MCFVVLCSAALEQEQPKDKELVCKTTHCTAHLEQIAVYQGTPRPLLNSKTLCNVFTIESHYFQKGCRCTHCQVSSTNSTETDLNLTTNSSLTPLHPLSNTGVNKERLNTQHLISCANSSSISPLCVPARMTTPTNLVCDKVPKGRQQKGGSKSSTSSSSSHRSGGSGNRQRTTGGHSRGSRRGFSSGSSDSSEDDKDDDDKRQPPHRRRNKEPKSKSGFSDDEDDEATDSADEGGNQDTPNSMRMDFSPQSQKGGSGEGRGTRSRGGSKDRFRHLDLPTGQSKSRGSNGSSSSTISVESLVITKESGQLEALPHVPQSPINMAVGYGIPSSVAPLKLESTSNQLTEKSPTDSTKGLSLGTPTLDSPRPLAVKEVNSPGTPPTMSPEIPPTFPVESATSIKVPTVPLQTPMAGPAATSGLPGGGSFGTLPFETTWGWQPPVYSPFALPGSSHPGSVATTPAPTSDNTGGFLRPGTTALLQATVCQESDGVLIVTVRWRNRNFSGSLIDIGHHDWAPPKLSCPYGDIQIKDLYNKQKEAAETQSITVDVLEDSKEVSSLQSKNEPEIVISDSPKESSQTGKAARQETGLQPPVPMETESITVMASSDPSEVGQANLRTLLTQPEGENKSPYSDISDGSDTDIGEAKPKKPSKESKQASESHVVLPTMNGFYPYKIESRPNKGKESLSTMSARLPSFGEVGRPTKSSRKDDKTLAKGEECIPDSQPSSPKERSSKRADSALEVRSALMSTYPSSSTTAATSVSVPEQDQRHSRVGVPSFYGNSVKVSGSSKSHDDASRSALHTLSDVAASLLPVNNKDKQPKHTKMTMLTQEDFKQESGRVRRSVSPRPSSLVPKANSRRSPSPARFSKQTLEQQAATLPSFDPAPGSKRASEGGAIPSPPIVVKPGTCEWGQESSRDEDGHDSDSSGSGSLLTTVNRSKPHKISKKHSKTTLSEIKTDKSSRDEAGNAVLPQTPALAPIPSDKFSLKNIQPISPGPEGPHPPTGHPIHAHKIGAVINNKKGSDAHPNSRLHLETRKVSTTARDGLAGSAMQVPTVGDALKKLSGTPPVSHAAGTNQVSSGHTVITMQNNEVGVSTSNPSFVKHEPMTSHEQEKDHHRVSSRHSEERRGEQQLQFSTYHQRVRPDAVIHISDDTASPGKEESKPDATRGRKRGGADLQYAASKRHERDEHSVRDKKISRQFPESLQMVEGGEEMEVPDEFKAHYDPNMPMSINYQYIAYLNQKRMQDEHQQQMEASKTKLSNQMLHHVVQLHDGKNVHSHPRRQKSNDHLNPYNSLSNAHEVKLPRQSSGESNHRSSLTNITTQNTPSHGKSHQNGSSVIHNIKSEPEEIRYLPVSKGSQGDSGKTPVVCSAPGAQSQQAGPGRRSNPSVRRPAPRKNDEPSWPGYRQPPPTMQVPHSHMSHGIAVPGYPHWAVAGPADTKPKHENSESSRNGESGSKRSTSGQLGEMQRPNSSFSPVIAGRPPTSSPSHNPHSHHHRDHVATNRAERERERESSKHPPHNFPSHQEHERRVESERESSAHIHSSQQSRQNSSSSTSSNHSSSHPSASSSSSRNPTKEQVNQAAALQMAQQQQMLQMQQLAALQQLQQQQQLSPNAIATLQRNAGGIPVEEYVKHLQQQQQQQYEMLKASAIQTPTAINPQDLIQLQMQMAASMGMSMDPNTAMALLVHQQQQAQQQAVQQQQQQEAQAQAVAAQQAALIQAAAQNSVLPLVYPIATPSGQISFYDPNALAGGMQVPFGIPNVPKRE